MKPVDVNSSTYIDFDLENSNKNANADLKICQYLCLHMKTIMPKILN